MGYCPTKLKAGLGAGLGTGRAGRARGTQARRRRHWRAGAGRTGSGGAGARRAGARALGAQGERAHGRRALGRWALGRWARWANERAWTGAGVRGRARHWRATDRYAGRGRRAGHGRLGGLGAAWACSWANGLCTRCTRPVFGPVRLGSFLSHQMNTVHYNIIFF